jgi:methionyl-tRNA formyltransferase
MTKIFILTSNYLRHNYFVNYLNESHEVVGVVSEVRTNFLKSNIDQLNTVVINHFKEREEKELFYFGKDNSDFNIDTNLVVTLNYTEVNGPEIFELIKSQDPEYVILFGCSLIKEHLLSYYKKKIINLHLGLSPYYRGVATNFWPLVNKEPQCVGATIHYATVEVDGGDILTQVRPDISTSDEVHDFGCKTIINASEAVSRTVTVLKDDGIEAKKQVNGGKLYKAKDFNIEAVLRMKKNFKDGMVEEYLSKKEECDSRFPIIDNL